MKKLLIYSQDNLGGVWIPSFEFWDLFFNNLQTTFYNKDGDVVGSVPHSTAFKIEKI